MKLVYLLAALAAVLAFTSLAGHMLMARQEPLALPPNAPWPGAAYIQLPTGRTHYIDIGPREGPVILLFHGSARGVADFQDGFGDALATDFRVIAFDYFGNGFSDRHHGWSYGSRLWAEQAIEFLDALKIEGATFVGHSVGGVVAAMAAAKSPARASALVTIGTGVAIDPTQILPLLPGAGEIALGMRPILSTTFSDQHAAFIRQAHAIDSTRGAYLVYVRRQYTVDGLPILLGLFERLSLPKLHLSGTDDTSVPHEAARALAKKSGGGFVPFPGRGHDLHIEAPIESAEAIRTFLMEGGVL